MNAGAAQSRVRGPRRIELSIGGEPVNPRRCEIALGVYHSQPQLTHRPLPLQVQVHFPPPAAIRFEQPELRKATFVRDVSDPLSVRRKTWVELIPLPEGQLVWRAALGRNDIQMVVL